MTRKQIQEFQMKSDTGELSDELNPAFLFSTTWTALLSDIAASKINAVELAKRELENRGLDINGKWVGFGRVMD